MFIKNYIDLKIEEKIKFNMCMKISELYILFVIDYFIFLN